LSSCINICRAVDGLGIQWNDERDDFWSDVSTLGLAVSSPTSTSQPVRPGELLSQSEQARTCLVLYHWPQSTHRVLLNLS